MLRVLVFVLTLFGSSAQADDVGVIQSIGDLSGLIESGTKAKRPIDAAATVIFRGQDQGSCRCFVVAVSNVAARIHSHTTLSPQVGDRLLLKGIAVTGIAPSVAYVNDLEIIGHEPPPPHLHIDAQSLNSGMYDGRLVSLSGVIVDAFQDEIDPRFTFFILACGPDTVYALLNGNVNPCHLAEFIGAEVVVSGICDAGRRGGYRTFLTDTLNLADISAIKILKPAPADPFDATLLDQSPKSFKDITLHPFVRKRITGKVIAVWDAKKVLIETGENQISTVYLDSAPVPQPGTSIEAVGYPITDLFSIGLRSTSWRKTANLPFTTSPAINVSPGSLFLDEDGRRKFDRQRHGQLIKTTGSVQSLPFFGASTSRLVIVCDNKPLNVDCSLIGDAVRDLCVGDKIEVTGVCIMETRDYPYRDPFPHIEDILLAPRSLNDLRLIARSPQVILSRITTAALILLSAIIVLMVFLSKKAKFTSKVRIVERTRLAVELHDSIAQSLTGAGLEIMAAQSSDKGNDSQAHMANAAQIVKSCRRELRNCIWDLRNNALDEKNLNEAIRRSLEAHVGNATISIRFNVPRKLLADDDAHKLICIIRELTINALRHGNASHIRIAGCVEADKVLLSVRDNGTGFNTSAAPGIDQGHFGLQGIRERLESLGGEMTIDSEIGTGTKVSAWIRLKC